MKKFIFTKFFLFLVFSFIQFFTIPAFSQDCQIIAEAGETQTICLGNQTTLIASGGTSYSWSTGFSNDSTDVSPSEQTTYYVTVSNSEGCTGVDSVIVFINNVYSIEILQDNIDICSGEKLLISINSQTNRVAYKNEDEKNFIKIPLHYTPTSFSVEFWIFPFNIYSYSHIIGYEWGSFVFHARAEGGIYCGTSALTRFSPTKVPMLPAGTLEPNKWQHFVYTYDSIKADSGICNFYKNSILLATKKMYRPDLIDTFRVQTLTNGFFDELRIWNVARTKQEIEDNMYLSLTGEEEGLVGYWNFEDSTVNDVTSNNHNGFVADEANSWTNVVPMNNQVLWSTGETTSVINIQPEVSTKYKVTITDNGCSKVDSVAISILESPNISAGADRTVCMGNDAKLSATGAGINGTYSWTYLSQEEILSTDSIYTVNLITTTTYVLEGKDSKCSNKDTIVVNVIPTIVDKIITPDTSICKGSSVSLYTEGNFKSLYFDGVNDDVNVSNDSKLQITGNQTIEMWVYPKTYGTSSKYLYNKARGGEGSILTVITGQVRYNYGTSGTNYAPYQDFISSGTLNLNQWNHIAAVRDTVNMKLKWYLNGVLDREIDALYSSAAKSTSAVNIGGPIGTCFNGNIDEIRVWNRVLTYDEIIDKMYKQLNVEDENGLVAYWRMNEATGTTTSDYSGNNLNGTILNGALFSSEIPFSHNYNWSTGETTKSITVSPESSTSYILTVSSGTCYVKDTVVINVNKGLSNLTNDTALCAGKTIILSCDKSDTYSWSTGATTQTIEVTPTEETTYKLTVTQNTCTSIDSVIVTNITIPNAYAGEDSLICAGSSININATGGGNYLWSTGETTQSISVTPENNSTYSLTVTNLGCTDTDEIAITIRDFHIIQNDTIIYKGDSLLITVNSLSNKYSLDVNGNNSTISGYVKIPINYFGNTFSVEWWIFPYSLSAYNVIGNSWGKFVAHNNIDGVMYVGTDLNTRFNNTNIPAGTIEVGKWQHFAFTFNNGSAKFYKNGTLIANKSGMTNPNGVIDTIYINQLSGLFDEFKFWNKELSQTDIQNYMYEKNNSTDANLITYITFDNSNLNDYTSKNNAISSYNLVYNKDISSNASCIWNTGETTTKIKVKPNITTTYTVTISDCFDKTEQIIVSIQNTVSADGNEIIMKGGNTTLSASMANSYSWSNGQTSSSINVSPTINTKYYVTGYSNGLESIDSVEVFIYPDMKDTNIYAGDTISINASFNKQSLNLSDTIPYARLLVVNQPELEISGNITIEMWIYNYGADNDRNIFYKNRTAEGVIWIGNAGGKSNVLVYQYGNGGIYQSFVGTTSIEINKWTHIALVRDLTNAKLYWYINGALDKETSAIYTESSSSSTNIYIGFSGTKFNGLLDEFRIWNKALTKEELKEIMYNKLSDIQNESTILNIDFDSHNLDTIYNSSPNKINGILSYGATLSNKHQSLLNYSWSNSSTNSYVDVCPTITSTYTITLTNGETTKTEQVIVYVNQLKENYESNNNNNLISIKQNNLDIDLFPNPASSSINIVVNNYKEDESLNLSIYNTIGQIVYNNQINPSKQKTMFNINLSELGKGIFIIRLSNQNVNEKYRIVID